MTRANIILAQAARGTALASLLILLSFLAAGPTVPQGSPSPEEYAARVGSGAQILRAGELVLDGRVMICGRRPTVIDDKLDDYGAAYPGFIILNSRFLSRVSTPVKLWIFSHECGHQFRGPDEETADCFAVQRGRREGWLSPDGLEEICAFISSSKGDSMHFAGTHRCKAMRTCYADPSVR
jgi:hypothetical protein